MGLRSGIAHIRAALSDVQTFLSATEVAFEHEKDPDAKANQKGAINFYRSVERSLLDALGELQEGGR